MLESFLPRERTAEVLANRRAGDNTRRSAEKRTAILESQQDSRGELGSETVRAARDRIRLVNEARKSSQPRGQNRRGRSEAAHSQHNSGPVFPIDRTAVLIAFPKPPEKPDKGWRDHHRRHADRGEFF